MKTNSFAQFSLEGCASVWKALSVIVSLDYSLWFFHPGPITCYDQDYGYLARNFSVAWRKQRLFNSQLNYNMIFRWLWIYLQFSWWLFELFKYLTGRSHQVISHHNSISIEHKQSSCIPPVLMFSRLFWFLFDRGLNTFLPMTNFGQKIAKTTCKRTMKVLQFVKYSSVIMKCDQIILLNFPTFINKSISNRRSG